MEERSHTRHLPSYGRLADAPPTGRRAYAMRLCGVLLVVLGVLADSSAGLMILVRQDVWGLLVHVPAALGWALGISVLNGRLPWRAPGGASARRPLAQGGDGAADQRLNPPPAHADPAYLSRRMLRSVRLPWRAPGGASGRLPLAEAGDGAPDQRPNGTPAQADPAYLNRWLLTSLLLGLVLFPGLGSLGCTVGFGVSRLLDKGAHPDPEVGDHVEPLDPAGRLDQAVDPLRELQIQPLVDILRQPNSELKRAAIAVLGRRGSREAMRLVRGALTDPDPDVRSDAAVTLSRLEDDFNRALSQAAARGLESPHGAERYADLCYRYATSDLLDAATRRYYLAQARDALQQVTALQPERAEVWTDLARVCYDLGEEAAAWQALDRAQALHPGHVAGYLLGMEMAFDARDWDRLAAYAHQGRLAAGDDHQDRELLSWWAHAQPLVARGADRSTT